VARQAITKRSDLSATYLHRLEARTVTKNKTSLAAGHTGKSEPLPEGIKKEKLYQYRRSVGISMIHSSA